MRIEHLAIWSDDIDQLKEFYIDYFDAKSSRMYLNPSTGFTSYFLNFGSDCKLEIMNTRDVMQGRSESKITGLAHFAIGFKTNTLVTNKTNQLRNAGYIVVSEPRITGDGYFESVVLDPEGNTLELVTQ